MASCSFANIVSEDSDVVIRAHGVGDIGVAISRHGVLYAQEQGWDVRFEASVADVLGGFVRNFNPERERGWIAEIDGEFAGCVFISDVGDNVARLRCLLVEPTARGHGVGTKLVDECIAFCRDIGYDKIELWTTPDLEAARRLYGRAGFVRVGEESFSDFGQQLAGEIWKLELSNSI